MTTPLRVTIVCSLGAIGGAEVWLFDLLESTDRLKVDAVVLARGPLTAEFDSRAINCAVIEAGRTPASLVAPTLRLASRLRQSLPDVVLANGFKAGLVAGAAGRIAGVRVVWVKHDHSFDGWRTQLVSMLCSGSIATSSSLAFVNPKPSVQVIPPPRHQMTLRDRKVARDEIARMGVRLGDRLAVAVVGRLVEYKGIEDAIRALAEPHAQEWELVVVGDDDPHDPGERRRLTCIANELGIAERVSFTGAVQNPRVLYLAFDAVAVLTRSTKSGPAQEGFGITALEAMIAGLPLICVGPSPPANRLENRAGIVVPAERPDLIAEALALLSNEAMRQEMGAAGREIASRHPSPNKCADMLVSSLSTIAKRPGAGLVGAQPLSVVVTVLNEKFSAVRLLRALVVQLRLSEDEIIVVDGGSTDGTLEDLSAEFAADSRVQIISRPGAGISAGRNAGVKAAASDWIVCTDAGCTPVVGWLEAFRSAAAESDSVDLLTGVYRATSKTSLQEAMAATGYPDPSELRHPSILVDIYGRLLGRTFDARMPTGRSVAFTRAAWDRVGGFPESLQTGEDVTFGRAVANSGGARMVADAEVNWEQRNNLTSTIKMYYNYGYGSGRSLDPLLLARDAARAVALLTGLILVARGRRGRRVVACGAAGYLSLPLRRALAGKNQWLVVAHLIPVTIARDMAKAAGCAVGIIGQASRTGRCP